MRNSLQGEKQRHEARLAELRAAIDAGDSSGVAEGNVFAYVRKALRLPTQRLDRTPPETRAMKDEGAGQ